MKKHLFLDDLRNPEEAFSYTNEKMFIEKEWDVVRRYSDFVYYIEQNGLPEFISFDHDLSDIHINKSTYKEKTGFTCAQWLIEYCMDNNLRLPNFYCHSMNPVGKDNINNLLNNFKNAAK